MDRKPRCPECESVCRVLYRREGKTGLAKPIPGWGYCLKHGPVRVDST